MSETMKRKKMEDIENLEKEEQRAIEETKEDKCPACGLPTTLNEFFNLALIKTFGWVECTRCGNVYSPASTMRQKRLMAKSGIVPNVQEAPSLILPQ